MIRVIKASCAIEQYKMMKKDLYKIMIITVFPETCSVDKSSMKASLDDQNFDPMGLFCSWTHTCINEKKIS